MASVDPTAWLRATPPFRDLPAERFGPAAEAVDVVYHPAGSWLVRTGGKPLEHLFVIRKGAVRLERDGQTLQVLEEGETFGYTSLITGQANLDVQVEEDLVAYRLPAAEFQRLLEDAQFASHFAVGLAERLKSALSQPPAAAFRTDLSLEVQQVAREPAVWVDADATVGEAAWRMRAERASSRARPRRAAGDRHRPRPAEPGARRGARPRRARRRRRDRLAADGPGRDPRLRGLGGAPRRRRPPPPGRARRRDRRGPHLHRPPPLLGPGPHGGAAPGRAAPRAREPARVRGHRHRDGVGAPRRRPRRDGHRRVRGPAQRRAPRTDRPDGGGRPRRAAVPVGLARPRVGGADGADPPHRSGQRPRVGGGGGGGAVLVRRLRGARQRRPRGGGIPALHRGLHGPGLERDARRVGAPVRGVGGRALAGRGPPRRHLLRLPAGGGDAGPRAPRGHPGGGGEEAGLRPLPRARGPRVQAAAAPAHHPARPLHGGPEAPRHRAGGPARALLRPRAGRRRPEHPRPARGRREGGDAPRGRLRVGRRLLPVPGGPAAPAPARSALGGEGPRARASPSPTSPRSSGAT